MSDIGAVSWNYTSDNIGKFFQWTTADVSALNAGDSITLIRYRFDGESYPCIYSVWKGTVVEINGINTIKAKTDEYTEDLSMAKKKNIENIIPYYNDHASGNPLLD